VTQAIIWTVIIVTLLCLGGLVVGILNKEG